MSTEKDIEKKVNLEGFAASLELPEGHQLVLGELPPGTVVEVATWQGTGRPDETTNRFLLSASGNGLQRRDRHSQTSSSQPQAESAKEISAPDSQLKKSIGSVGAGASYLGMRTFGVDTPPAAAKKNGFSWKTLGQGVFTAISIIAITSLVLSLFGISAVVPTRGAKTALGPSTNALVIYKKTPSVTIGSPTVALIPANGNQGYLFGPSNSFDNKTLQIETTSGQELVDSKNVVGRAFLAIPLLGILAKPFIG
jgi:hypothetical protein